MTCKSIPRQRLQHTANNMVEVFSLRHPMNSCYATRAVTSHNRENRSRDVISVTLCPCRGYITSLLLATKLDWRTGSELRD
jgi:hypothetical protein